MTLAGLEVVMVSRRRGPRLALLAGVVLVGLIDWRGDYLRVHGHHRQTAYAVWLVANAVTLLPLIAGSLATGGTRRNHQNGVGELHGTSVIRPWRLALARYLGTAGPTLAAALVLIAVMMLLALGKTGGHYALITLAAAAVMLIPAVLVMVAVGMALRSLLPFRYAEPLTAAIYVWALLAGIKGLPSIGRTPLDPTVTYARRVLFHTDAMMSSAPFHPAASAPMLVLNLAVLAVAIVLAIAVVAWRERPL